MASHGEEMGTPVGRWDFTFGAGMSALGLNMGCETPLCSIWTMQEPKVSMGTLEEAVAHDGTAQTMADSILQCPI